MKTYIITYHLMPDNPNVEVQYTAKSEEDAVVFAKQYRKDSFSIKEDKQKEERIK